MTTDDDSPLAATEVHYLHSENVGDEFKIFVGRCHRADNATPPAVLYITDANGLFASAVDIVRLLQLSAHLPPLLVVGIGYRMGGLADTQLIRHRDLTPTSDPWYARLLPDGSPTGGADNFLAFIRAELKPWVHTHYSVDPNSSMFFGHSLGGLFATYTLLTEPDTFTRYGIGSPSLWWHDDMMFPYEARYAETHTDLPARAYFSVGAFEDHDGRQREASPLPEPERAVAALRYIDMVADTDRMVDRLRSHHYPTFVVDNAVFPDEFHITVPTLNLSRALRNLFDAPR